MERGNLINKSDTNDQITTQMKFEPPNGHLLDIAIPFIFRSILFILTFCSLFIFLLYYSFLQYIVLLRIYQEKNIDITNVFL